MANPGKLAIKVPEVSIQPGVCFQVVDYELSFKNDPTKSPSFVVLAIDKTGYEVGTNDRAEVGLHELTLKAVISNGQKIEEHDF